MDFNPLSLLQMMGSGNNNVNSENLLKILSAMNGNTSGLADSLPSNSGLSALLPLLQGLNMNKSPLVKSGDNVNATIYNLMKE
jgi:hypothetical protein